MLCSLQILTSRCGCTLATNGWRSAKRPSTSAHWSRCLMRRSPSTCRGRRSANVRSTSASWISTTSAATSSSVAFHSPVSASCLLYNNTMAIVYIARCTTFHFGCRGVATAPPIQIISRRDSIIFYYRRAIKAHYL